MTLVQMRRYIAAKRDGHALPDDAWRDIVAGFCAGTVDDAQMAALAMACVLRGMERGEIVALTAAMVASGERLTLPAQLHCVDKHSTGGVGDTVSLIIVPIVAACGVRVAKLSGRALGHTGGTLDKLEAIPGCRTDLDPATFAAIVERVGCAIGAQSASFVPADKRLYALRDHTATIPGIGLIVASIVSKKIAGGAEAFVFDVKTGRGAFARDEASSRELAQTLVDVAAALGRPSCALITDMEEPLGRAIGSGLETIEARDFLRGTRRDPRLLEVGLALGEALLELGGTPDNRRAQLVHALESGAADRTFRAMIQAQGAEEGALDQLTAHPRHVEVRSEEDGVVAAIDPVALGETARECVRHSGAFAGIVVHVRSGDAVNASTPLATVYGEYDAHAHVREAFTIGKQAPAKRSLVHAIVRSHSSGTAAAT